MVNKVPCKIKRLNLDAKIPTQATPNDTGYDLYAISEKTTLDGSGCTVTYGTGIAIELDKNFAAYIAPRSSITKNTTLMLGNNLALIDSDFRGEIMLQFRNLSTHGLKKYKIGDKIGQLFILPRFEIKFEEVEELTSTVRNQGGFGSSGA